MYFPRFPKRAFFCILTTLFSPYRGKPCAVSVLRFLWFALGVVPIISPRAHSHILRGVSHFRNTTRAPRVSFTNRFCGFAFVFAFFVALYLAKFARGFAFPFVSVSVRYPYSLRPLFPFSRVPFGCPLWVLVISVLCSRVAVVSCVWFGLRPQTFRGVFQFLPPLVLLAVCFYCFTLAGVVISPKTAAKVVLYLGGLLECLKKNAFSL